MFRTTGTFLLVSLCMLAQMLCAALPQGMPVCIRPVVTVFAEESVTGTTPEPCGCCCDCSDDTTTEDQKAPPAPCTDPECLLCIQAVHQLLPSRASLNTDADACPLPALWTVPALIPLLPELAERCEHPPPTVSPPRSRDIVGTVILLV